MILTNGKIFLKPKIKTEKKKINTFMNKMQWRTKPQVEFAVAVAL